MFILLLAIKIRNFEKTQPSRSLTNDGLKISALVATINNVISNPYEMNELLTAAESARISAAARMNATERAAAAAKAEATAKAEAEARAKIAEAEARAKIAEAEAVAAAAAAAASKKPFTGQLVNLSNLPNWSNNSEIVPPPQPQKPYNLSVSGVSLPPLNNATGTGLNPNPPVVEENIPTVPNQLNAGVPELPMIEYEPPKRFWNKVRNYTRKARNTVYAAPGAIRNTAYAVPGALGRGIGAVGSTIAAAPGALGRGIGAVGSKIAAAPGALRNTAYATPSALLTGARTVGSTFASVPGAVSSGLSGLYSWLRPSKNNTKKTQGGRRRRNRKTYRGHK